MGANTTIDFESFQTGEPPPGFSIAVTGGAAATWVVQDDPTAHHVLAQTSSDRTSGRFPLCIYDGFSGGDVTVSVRFKAIAGTVDQAAGIVWRYQDADNYYIVRANALEDNVVLYKVEKGKRTDLKPVGSWPLAYGKKVKVPTGQWHTLQVVARGPRFGVSLNGEHLFDVEDGTFVAPGKVGLWTKTDSVTAFDDLRIDPVAPAQQK